MRTKTHRTEITIESHEVKVIRFACRQPKVFCEICKSRVNAIAPERAVETTRLDLVDLYRLIESGRIHVIGTSDGRQLLCVKSLGNNTAGGQL